MVLWTNSISKLQRSYLEHQIAHIDRALENDDGKIVEIRQIAELRFDELRNAIINFTCL
jgi:hypothetical protein